jgi:hypothetical protein
MRERACFVRPHEAGVADHVGSKDGHQPSLDSERRHASLHNSPWGMRALHPSAARYHKCRPALSPGPFESSQSIILGCLAPALSAREGSRVVLSDESEGSPIEREGRLDVRSWLAPVVAGLQVGPQGTAFQ